MTRNSTDKGIEREKTKRRRQRLSCIQDLNLGRVWQGWGLGVRWLLVAVLSILTVLGPMPVMATPAYAQSPYEEMLAQIELLRQQCEQILAGYESMDAEGRAILDAQTAAGMQQGIQQAYSSMPASQRAELDEEMRRLTGYSVLQHMQMASTVPGLVKSINLLCDALENLIRAKGEETRAGEEERPAGTVGYLTEKKGDVRVKRNGEYLTTSFLQDGDRVITGKNSSVTVDFDGSKVTLGPNSQFEVVERIPPSKVAERITGVIRCFVEAGALLVMVPFFVLGEAVRPEVETPTAVAAVRGTEFTMSVAEDGTTTVTVLDGIVEVQDLASNSIVSLEPFQMITVPKVPGGLEQQDMLGRVTRVDPKLIDRWWEEELPPTPVPTPSPGVAPAVGGPVILIVVILLVIAIILIPTLLLRRRRGRRPVKEPSEEWLETLKMRLAKGEITPEEYEELKKTLKET